jgi:putative transposase
MSLEGIFRRRRLPHWDVTDATYFVTTCLAGSIPAIGLDEINRYRSELESRPLPAAMSKHDWEVQKHKLIFKRLDDWLDHQPAARHLADPRLAKIVHQSLNHFAGERYKLFAFVVMPSHFHWVFAPTPSYCEQIAAQADGRTPRERIMKSIKGYAARACNKLLGRTGTFWQDESYDHCVRGEDELLRIIEYVEQNPVKARLVQTPEEWAFSSAAVRIRQNVRAGQPLRRGDNPRGV